MLSGGRIKTVEKRIASRAYAAMVEWARGGAREILRVAKPPLGMTKGALAEFRGSRDSSLRQPALGMTKARQAAIG